MAAAPPPTEPVSITMLYGLSYWASDNWVPGGGITAVLPNGSGGYSIHELLAR